MRLPFRLLVSSLSLFASAKAATLTWDINAANGPVPDYGSGTWNTSNAVWNNGLGNVVWTNAPVNDALITGATSGVATITIGANPLTAGTITVGGAGSTTVFNGTYANLTANEIVVQTSGAGKLAFTSAGTMANVANFTVGAGATLFASGMTIDSAISVAGSGNTENRGALRLESNARLQGSINLTGDATFGTSSSASIDSTIAGNFAVNLASVGGGTLRFGGDNTYSGGTILTNHTVQAGHNNAFGTGTLQLNGGVLTSDSTTARTFANAVTIGVSAVTLGHATNSGKLTFSGAVQSGLASTTITAASAVEFADLRTSGTITQAGSGAMTVGRFTAQSSNAVLAGSSINLAAGGTTFDTAGYNAAVTGTLAGSSGFTKVGAGTLTLNSAHAFTGAVRVAEGTLHLAPQISLPSNLDVMPLGDSITYGAGAAGGYRAPLYNLIQPIAPGVRFVGDSSLNPGSLPAGQQSHAGHSSYSTLDIYRNLDGLDSTTFNTYGGADRNPNGGYWLTGGDGTNGTPNRAALFPDVVLLLVGTNDVYRADTGVTDQRQSYTNLIDKLTTLRPEAEIFMAKITPHASGSGAEVAKVAAYNAMVTLVYNEAKAAGKHVTLVDLNTGFPAGAFVDSLHPNQTGYEWMAARWRDAMLSTLGTPLALDFRNTPLITVEAGAKLSGTALVNALDIRGAIAPGGDNVIGFIRAGNTALSGNYLCDLSATGADLLDVTGNLDLGAATLTLSSLEILSSTSYVIASYTGDLTGDFVTINGLPVGYQYVNDIAGKRLMLTQVPESSTYALFAGPALLLLARRRGVRRAARRRVRDEAPLL